MVKKNWHMNEIIRITTTFTEMLDFRFALSGEADFLEDGRLTGAVLVEDRAEPAREFAKLKYLKIF